MKNKWIFLQKYRVWILIGFVFGIAGMFFVRISKTEGNITHVCNKKVCFEVEVVTTPEKRQQGLMYRESMSEGSGMLFVFETSDIYNFWMKNTLIPLDILRIDKRLRVVRILTAQPCKENPCTIYTPEIPAKYVLEINAGLANKYSIVEGTKMRLIK